MFVWKASVILEQFAKLLPDIYADLLRIGDSMGTAQEKEVIRRFIPIYTRFPLITALWSGLTMWWCWKGFRLERCGQPGCIGRTVSAG